MRTGEAVLLVACGGAAGGVLRQAVRTLLPSDPGAWDWSVLAVNAAGGFALAALLSVLARRPSERARLLVGTGLLGGLTTFSALVVETVLLAEAGLPAAIAYVVVAVVTLLGAAWLGVRLAAPGSGGPAGGPAAGGPAAGVEGAG